MESQNYNLANKKLMNRMGGVIANNKSDFVDMLDTCNVNFSGIDDAELISCYIDEIPSNNQLKVMSAYLLEHNEASSFSGQIENDQVYDNYNVIYNYWDFNSENSSNAGGGGAGGGGVVKEIAKAVSGGFDVSSKAIDAKQRKKYGAIDTAQKQADTRAELIKSVIAQKQTKSDMQTKTAEQKQKTTRNWIIAGSIVGGIAIIGTLIYFIRKK